MWVKMSVWEWMRITAERRPYARSMPYAACTTRSCMIIAYDIFITHGVFIAYVFVLRVCVYVCCASLSRYLFIYVSNISKAVN